MVCQRQVKPPVMQRISTVCSYGRYEYVQDIWQYMGQLLKDGSPLERGHCVEEAGFCQTRAWLSVGAGLAAAAMCLRRVWPRPRRGFSWWRNGKRVVGWCCAQRGAPSRWSENDLMGSMQLESDLERLDFFRVYGPPQGRSDHFVQIFQVGHRIHERQRSAGREKGAAGLLRLVEECGIVRRRTTPGPHLESRHQRETHSGA